MFEQIAFDENLAQGLVIRQHRNDRVAAKSIGSGRGNLGASPFQLVQQFAAITLPIRPVPRNPTSIVSTLRPSLSTDEGHDDVEFPSRRGSAQDIECRRLSGEIE